MKSTKKIILAAGVLVQLSASMYADNWSDAVAAFGGVNVVYNNRGALAWSDMQAKAKQIGTAEAMSIALYESEGNPNVLANKFPGAMSQNIVESALQNIINASVPTRTPAPTPVPTPVNTQPAPSTGTTWSQYLFGSNGNVDAQAQAAIQAAMQTQQQADAALAAANSQALASVVNSGATGASLYNSYIDLIMNALQQALSSIADPAVKQQVVSYAQNKLSNMKASASMNSHNSHALGRMNSNKKAVKKSKHSRLHATR